MDEPFGYGRDNQNTEENFGFGNTENMETMRDSDFGFENNQTPRFGGFSNFNFDQQPNNSKPTLGDAFKAVLTRWTNLNGEIMGFCKSVNKDNLSRTLNMRGNYISVNNVVPNLIDLESGNFMLNLISVIITLISFIIGGSILKSIAYSITGLIGTVLNIIIATILIYVYMRYPDKWKTPIFKILFVISIVSMVCNIINILNAAIALRHFSLFKLFNFILDIAYTCLAFGTVGVFTYSYVEPDESNGFGWGE